MGFFGILFVEGISFMLPVSFNLISISLPKELVAYLKQC
jgi:hypothetical protein